MKHSEDPGPQMSLTCFLTSAVSDHDLADEVRSVLTELGINVRTADDLQPGSDIGATLVEAVFSAAFVCVVMSDTPPPPAVMFEAGIATGSRRPVLIIDSSRSANQVPNDLLSAPVIRHKRGSTGILKDSLNAYVHNVQPVASQLTVNWDVLVNEEVQVKEFKPGTERSAAGQVAARLDKAGALVATDGLIANRRMDIIATFPTLGTSFNPVLIEIKSRSSNRESHLRQMFSYLRDANVRLGLIVYRESTRKPEVRATDSTGVLLVSSHDLMRWDDHQIVREITKLRNQVVHSA